MGIGAAIGVGLGEAGFGAGIGFGALEGAGAAAAGALGAEGAFAGGAAALGAAGAEAGFAGGALGALGAEASFGGALGAGLGAEATFLGSESLGALGGEFGAEAATSGGFDQLASLDGIDSSVTGLDATDLSGIGDASTASELNLEPWGSDPYSQAQTDYLGNQTSADPYAESRNEFWGNKGESPTTQGGDVVDKTVDPNYNPNQTPDATGRGTGVAKQAAAASGGGGQFNPGQLLNSLKQLAGGPSRPSALGSQSALAQQMADQGNQLLANYNAGILTAPKMAALKLNLAGSLNKIRQYYKSAGRYNSTDRIQAENLAYLQTTQAMAADLDRELQMGLQALGQAGSQFGQVANATISSDNAFRSSLGSALGSILRLPTGSGAIGNGQPSLAVYDQGGGGGGGGSGGYVGGTEGDSVDSSEFV